MVERVSSPSNFSPDRPCIEILSIRLDQSSMPILPGHPIVRMPDSESGDHGATPCPGAIFVINFGAVKARYTLLKSGSALAVSAVRYTTVSRTVFQMNGKRDCSVRNRQQKAGYISEAVLHSYVTRNGQVLDAWLHARIKGKVLNKERRSPKHHCAI